MSGWKTAKTSPRRDGIYDVYLDRSGANLPDVLAVREYRDGRWIDVRSSYCPVTHWRPRPRPPAGTWLSRRRYGRRAA